MGPSIVRSHLSMDVHVTVNVSDTHFVFSISFLIFYFSILFFTSKYLIIYCITKDNNSLLDELEDIYIYIILYITIHISYYILQKINKLRLIIY
jgi:hypothetical protein